MSIGSPTKPAAEAGRRMTAREYFELPEGPPWSQLIDGELVMSPSVNFYHQEILGRLHLAIGNYLRQHPLGKVIMAPSDVQLDEKNVFQPDLYFIRKERLGIVDEHGPKGAPDLVAEIISKRTRTLDLGKKKAISAERGVGEYWAVFPRMKEVHVYLLQQDSEKSARILSGADLLESPLFPGLKIPLMEIFEEAV